MAKASSKIGLDDWQLPLQMPREIDGLTVVGVPMPYYPDIEDFEAAWFTYDPLNWQLDDLNRREWATEIIAHFDQWKRYLGHDSTAIFKRTVQQKRAKGGILVGVRGIKGGGKSRLAQMVIQRICNVTPHVLFQYKDIGVQIKSTEGDEIGLLIDEDLTATGQDSANLVIHVNNSWETNRKAIQSGVCTGVNLSFERWGNTLDIRLEPCGINYEFLATRFGMFTSKNRFLGFGALQFKHLPEDPVYYYNELATWREYDNRANAFSRTVTRSGGAMGAVDDVSQTEHIEKLKLEFKARYIDKGLTLPPDIGCRRIYRKAKLPSKSIGYMNEVIWWAKDELEEKEDSESEPRVEMTAEGWEGLRESLEDLTKDPAFALYSVPTWPKMSYAEVGAELEESVLPDSLGKRIRNVRRRLSPRQLGDAGERWVASRIDSLDPIWGGGGEDVADILTTIGDTETALNVKVSMEEHVRREFPTTPENTWNPSFVVLVLPRLLQIRLFPITGQHTMINSRKGGLCAPESLAQAIEELVKNE